MVASLNIRGLKISETKLGEDFLDHLVSILTVSKLYEKTVTNVGVRCLIYLRLSQF